MKKIIALCLAFITILFSGVLLYAYNTDNKYNPSGSLADIQINQVVFDDDKVNDFSDNKNNNDSDLWEKDNDSLNKDRPNQSNDSNYLYNNKTTGNDLNINDDHNSQNNNNNIQGEGDTIYDVVDDKKKADTVIDIDKPAKDDNKEEDDKPTIKDPEKQKSNSVDSYIPNNKNYAEDEVNDRHEKRTVVICKTYDAGSDELYYGQTITPRMIFNYLDTYVDVGDFFTDNMTRYFWNEDAYDKYVRIEAVSFDGGETFIDDFPVTIPQGADLVIKAAYRYSTNDEWTSMLVDYLVSENRTILLKHKLTSDSIKNEDIANQYEQYYTSGKKVNLLKFVNEVYGLSYTGPIDKLFPGWMEDGEEVGWLYTTDYGRKILEPMDFIDIDDKYSLKLTLKWIDHDLHENLNGNLSYLQTLVNYESDEYDDYYFPFVDTLEVPKYVQAIEFGDDGFIRMNYVKVPDTVLIIDNSNAYFEVIDGWMVSEDNPNYCSDNGILYNKQKNQILDIPSSMEALKVDESIEYVAINRGNNLQKLIFDAKDSDKLPDVILDYLFDCKILVDDEVLDNFVENNYLNIQDLYGVSIATIDNEDISYILKNNAIISDQGLLRKALDYSSILKIDSSVNRIKANSFEDATNIDSIIILKDVDDLTIEKDAFINSGVKTISCSTVEQYNSLMAQKDNFGKEDIEIKMLSVSVEGYSYIVEDGEVTILNAPSDVKTFDGTLTLEDGSILNVSSIADNAFEGCNELEIVSLAESVKKIGYRAFADCEKLNGVLIKSKDYIEIGDLAFDNCTLRFFASNAMYASFDNNYFPYNFGNYYVLNYATGYNGYYSWFGDDVDIVEYDIYKTGERGAVLYGVGQANDYWLALESSKTLDNNVKLPSETIEIFSSSFAYSVSEDGQSYSVNWDELVNLEFIDQAAFAYSSLGEDIEINKTVFLDSGSTFMGCSYLKTFKMNNSEAISISDNFQYCFNLKSVEFNDVSDIKAASFVGCDSLEIIKLNTSVVPVLTIFSTNGTMYYFNDGFDNEESKKISFILPDDIQEAFIKEDIYLFAGYSDAKNMWNSIRLKLTDANNLIFPSDEEVWNAFCERLLLTENTMREFMNLDLVTSPTYLPDKTTFFTSEVSRQVMVDVMEENDIEEEANVEDKTNAIEETIIEDETGVLEDSSVEDKTKISEEVNDIEEITNEEKNNEETNIDKEKEMADTYDN